MISFPKRYALLKTFGLIYIVLSTLIRLVFFFWNFSEVDTSFLNLIYTFILGFLFDIGTLSFFLTPYVIYLLIVPKKLYGTLLDKIITYFAYSLGLIIFIFSFLSEITFWEEFKRRFNFIAVDYLVYTEEVVKNINESYPIPLLLVFIFILLLILLYFTKKRDVFHKTFNNETTFKAKLIPTAIVLLTVSIYSLFITNEHAEQFENRYNNELSKTGIYSFFAAFNNNELSYTEFYNTINEDDAFTLVKNKILSNKDSLFKPEQKSILRKINNSDSINKPIKPNVIFICIESLGSKRLSYFGSKRNITPNLDSLITKSIFFTNIFATGTRTIRGMEAITLSIPPTPGRSIVKRKNNQGLFTISEVFKQNGYESTFYYGGDGYFDNMNTYFGGNGFNIVDRGRGFLLDKSINATRTNIEDSEVTFENAWGVCDGDIYNKVLKEADKHHKNNQPYFNFIMTTSNHRPYTYPSGLIDIPSGKNRDGAIKYTDYAIGQFLKEASDRPWFQNTVFVIMSDHCAASAGEWSLDVKNYHIPAFIYNLPNIPPQKTDKLCSQIDLFPTLFALLNWDYTSNLFGQNVFEMKPNEERAFIGNYRKLGLLKEDDLIVLNDKKQGNHYLWNKEDNSLKSLAIDSTLLKETTSFYQVADYLYRNEGLKIKE